MKFIFLLTHPRLQVWSMIKKSLSCKRSIICQRYAHMTRSSKTKGLAHANSPIDLATCSHVGRYTVIYTLMNWCTMVINACICVTSVLCLTLENTMNNSVSPALQRNDVAPITTPGRWPCNFWGFSFKRFSKKYISLNVPMLCPFHNNVQSTCSIKTGAFTHTSNSWQIAKSRRTKWTPKFFSLESL